MKSRAKLFSLLLILPTLAISQEVDGVDPNLNIQLWIGERPNIENFEDEQQFVAQILKWEQQKAALERLHLAGELPHPNDNINEDPHDWHHITGPEDLEVAIQNAEGYEQPNYKEKYRFNRTTHISFPLAPVAPELDSHSPDIQTSQSQKEAKPEEKQDSLVMVDDSGYLVLTPAQSKISPNSTH